MNSNCDTFIKQEFPTAEEQLISSISGTDSNILVKNEPILDVPFSAVTIKNEPLTEATCFIETVAIKTEQNQEAILGSRDSFVIYELETQTQKIDGITTKVANPPPILLNDKLRKRHKVIIPAKSGDKRKRYNIGGTSSVLLEKSNSATTVSTMETSKTYRLLNSGNKQIINHLIKHKQKHKKSAENCDLSVSPTNIRNNKTQNKEQHIVANCLEQTTTTQTQPDTLAPHSPTILSSPVTIDFSNTPKKLTGSPIGMSELRVKCLCSLTGDTTSDNSELRAFFEKMFVQTRCLNKTQQRIVKMSVLKAICNAEDAVEQGKCCSF